MKLNFILGKNILIVMKLDSILGKNILLVSLIMGSLMGNATGAPALSFVDIEKNNSDGVLSMSLPIGVVLSPDEKNLYVSSNSDSAIVIFARDTVTGALSYVDKVAQATVAKATVANSVPNVDGLSGVAKLAMSPDGKHLYAAGVTNGSVAIFARDATTGTLVFRNTLKYRHGNTGNLQQAYAIAMSPRGDQLYVASHNPTGFPDVLIVLTRDLVTGELTFKEERMNGTSGIVGMTSPEDIAVSPTGEEIYLVSQEDHALVMFKRVGDTLIYHQTVVNNGSEGVIKMAAPRNIVVAPNGRDVYVTSMTDSAIIHLQKESVSEKLVQVHAYVNGAEQLSQLTGTYDLALSANGGHLAVSSLFDNPLTDPIDNSLTIFRRNPETGALTWLAKVAQSDETPGLFTPSDIALSSGGQHNYIIPFASDAEVGQSVVAYGLTATDLVVELSADELTIKPGEEREVTVTLKNVGEQTATAVVAYVNVDASLTGSVSEPSDDLICTVLSATVAKCALATFDAGANRTFKTKIKAPNSEGNFSAKIALYMDQADNSSGNNQQSLAIDVVNTPPVAMNDSAITSAGVPIDILVLLNDSDADAGDRLMIAQEPAPTVSNKGGTVERVVVNLSGEQTTEALRYTSPAGFFGNDQFSYTIQDNLGATAVATVSVTVKSSGGDPAPAAPGEPGGGSSSGGGGGLVADLLWLLGMVLLIRRRQNDERRTADYSIPV